MTSEKESSDYKKRCLNCAVDFANLTGIDLDRFARQSLKQFGFVVKTYSALDTCDDCGRKSLGNAYITIGDHQKSLKGLE